MMWRHSVKIQQNLKCKSKYISFSHRIYSAFSISIAPKLANFFFPANFTEILLAILSWMDFSFRHLACQYTNILIFIFIPGASISLWKKCLLCLKWVALLSKTNENYCPPVVQKGQPLNSNPCMCSKPICSTVNQVYVRVFLFLV